MSVETLGYQRAERRLSYADRALVAGIAQEIATACDDPLLRFVGYPTGRLHASILNGNEFARIARASGEPIEVLRTEFAARLGNVGIAERRVSARVTGFKFVGALENKPAFVVSSPELELERVTAIEFARDMADLAFVNDEIHVTAGEIRSLRTDQYQQEALQKLPTRTLQFGARNITDIYSPKVY